MHNSLVFRNGPLEVVGNVRFVRIQSIRVVNLLIVDVHFNNGKISLQSVLYMINKRNWSVFLRRLFLFHFYLFFVLLFQLLAIVSFVTTTSDKFQFQSQVRLSQMNVIVLIPLKFKHFPDFIKWGSRIGSLFMGRQDVVNYWDFPETATKGWYRKILDIMNGKSL